MHWLTFSYTAKMQALMEDVEYLKKSLQESEKEARLLNEELAVS